MPPPRRPPAHGRLLRQWRHVGAYKLSWICAALNSHLRGFVPRLNNFLPFPSYGVCMLFPCSRPGIPVAGRLVAFGARFDLRSPPLNSSSEMEALHAKSRQLLHVSRNFCVKGKGQEVAGFPDLQVVNPSRLLSMLLLAPFRSFVERLAPDLELVMQGIPLR